MSQIGSHTYEYENKTPLSAFYQELLVIYTSVDSSFSVYLHFVPPVCNVESLGQAPSLWMLCLGQIVIDVRLAEAIRREMR